MNKPIYEIPVNDGLNPGVPVPPPGVDAVTAPRSAPPPGVQPPAPALSAAPPPATPTAPTPYPGYTDPANISFGPPSAATFAPPAASSAMPQHTAVPQHTAAPQPTAAPPQGAPQQAFPPSDSGAALHAAFGAAPSYAPVPTPAPAPPVPVFSSSPQQQEINLAEGEMSEADVDLVTALIEVVRSGASDLHISADAPPMIRVHGALRPIASNTLWTGRKVRDAIYSTMTADQKTLFEKNLELDFAVSLSAASRFRVNVYQQREAIGAAFRLIPTEIKPLKSLGIPERVSQFAGLPRGLVLVTGPTGSGKSTTLAALIDLVNQTRSDHIVTVEDPIEFLHTNKKALINQREVGSDTHSFANALKHVLRQDPDVILIGELRDLETISVALTAAETGHLVFATLHTQDAAQTIDRVIDVFPPHQQPQVRAQLASTLQGVVCQTLIKSVQGGRVVATEIMITTPAIANLVREGKTFQIRSMLQAGKAQGMHTLDQHLADLVNAGVITHQAAYDKAQNPEELRQLIQRPEPQSY